MEMSMFLFEGICKNQRYQMGLIYSVLKVRILTRTPAEVFPVPWLGVKTSQERRFEQYAIRRLSKSG